MGGLKGFPDVYQRGPSRHHDGADLHPASGAPFAKLLRLEGSQGSVAKGLKRVYQAVDDGEAAKALDDFEVEWGHKYPSIAPSWRRAWQEVIPFFAFPPAPCDVP